ncbi:MAG: hypothetical protein EOO82_00985 [Oxalobacteraceae bacterium]|nr:MAG: hypothetical protein EOO82_00985 [Oxalobacteraceae bacterium]
MTFISSLRATVANYRLPQVDMAEVREKVLAARAVGATSLPDVGIRYSPEFAEVQKTREQLKLYDSVRMVDSRAALDKARRALGMIDPEQAASGRLTKDWMVISPNVSALDAGFVAESRHLFEEEGFTDRETIDNYADDLLTKAARSMERNGGVNFSGAWGDRTTSDVNEYVEWLYEASGLDPAEKGVGRTRLDGDEPVRLFLSPGDYRTGDQAMPTSAASSEPDLPSVSVLKEQVLSTLKDNPALHQNLNTDLMRLGLLLDNVPAH